MFCLAESRGRTCSRRFYGSGSRPSRLPAECTPCLAAAPACPRRWAANCNPVWPPRFPRSVPDVAGEGSRRPQVGLTVDTVVGLVHGNLKLSDVHVQKIPPATSVYLLRRISLASRFLFRPFRRTPQRVSKKPPTSHRCQHYPQCRYKTRGHTGFSPES